MTYNEILPNLFLGDLNDAIAFDQKYGEDGTIICVLESRPPNEPFRTYHIPVRTSSGYVHKTQLDHISFFLTFLQAKQQKTLVHCAAGLERSPLTIAYHLIKTQKVKDIAEAYEFIKKTRPEIYDRSDWLV